MPEITWDLFYRQVAECRLCSLCTGIRNKVPGQGDPASPLMLIGDGPGQTEDEEGLAFVGAAGRLLTKMLEAVQLPRERVYICNIVKCRPPNNRVPTPEEADACRIHLRMQTWLVRPKVIVLLGSTAAKKHPGSGHPDHPGAWKMDRAQGRMDHAHLPSLRPAPGPGQEARGVGGHEEPARQTAGTRALFRYLQGGTIR